MIQVGQVVKYLGIELEVESFNEASVKLKRSDSIKGTYLEVMIGSPRYYVIFPDENKVNKPFSFMGLNNKKDESVDSSNGRITDLRGRPLFSYSGIFDKFIHRYSYYTSDTIGHYAIKSLKKEILSDTTGILLFYLACYANQRSAIKFDFKSISQGINTSDKSLRPKEYKKSLLNYYLRVIGDFKDSSPCNTQDIADLNRLLPIEEGVELACAICSWNFNKYNDRIPDGKLVFDRGSALSLFVDIVNNKG